METKTDALLGALSKNELKSFNNFISNNLKGKSQGVLNCWTTRYIEIKNKTAIAERKVFSRKILSDLSKQLEKFLILRNLEKDEFSSTVFLTRELRKRNVNKYFEKLLYEIKNVKSKVPGKGYQNTLNLLKLNFEEYLLYNSLNDEKSLVETAKERFRISEILISHSKLFEYLNRRFYTADDNLPDSGLIKMEHVLSFIKENSVYFKKNFSNIWILYSLYRSLINDNDEKIIYSTLYFIRNNERNVTDEFLQFSYESLMRVLMKRIYKGSFTAFKMLYKIMLSLEQRGILSKLHHFQPQHFLIYIIISIYSDNIELAEKFVSDYGDKITMSLREPILNISRAMIEISKGNFDKAKKIVINEKPRDPTVYMFSKMTLLRAYYELNDLRNIYPLIDTLKHYIKRRSETGRRTPNVSLFLSYMSRLVFVKKNNGKKIEELETDLRADKYFFNKLWLIEKVKQLKKELR